MGDKAGAIKMIVGIMMLYAFIVYGISIVYEDESQSGVLEAQDNIAKWTMAEPESLNIVSNDALFGVGAFINGLWGIFKAVIGLSILIFKVASFSDPRIPYLLYLFVILPSNVTLFLATISLFR